MIINNKNRVVKSRKAFSGILDSLIEIQEESHRLPQLSVVEKVKFEQNLAIEQLYYSSKLEGTHLTDKMIEQAIHGSQLSAS